MKNIKFLLSSLLFRTCHNSKPVFYSLLPVVSLLCVFGWGNTSRAQTIQQDSAEVVLEPSLNRRRLAFIIAGESVAYVGLMSYLHFAWYADKERVPFHYYDDSKGYLQVDKLGHTFTAYLQSYASYELLRGAGVSKKHALLYGSTLGIVMQTPIEVFDGMYEGWGFSWYDMAANALGSGIVAAQALAFDAQPIKMKFSFWRSQLADRSHGYLGNNFAESLLYDYNGHSYWFSVPLSLMAPGRKYLPPWLCISAGYSAAGMLGEFENDRFYYGKVLPEAQRYRQFLLSADVDLSRIPTRSNFLKGVFSTFFWIKIPFPTLEITSKGNVKGHWLYF